MLTRFVRIQLLIFSVASVVGLALMAFNYLQLPTVLGIGRITVTMQLPAGGGLYQLANVTVRGVQMGKVLGLELVPGGAEVKLSLKASPKIPADLRAEVRSVSAVGEQYVDLQPRTDTAPYLANGSVIPKSDVVLAQQVGPMLDQASELLASVPRDKLSKLLDETFTGFNGADFDISSLIDSSATLSAAANSVSDQTRDLTIDSAPLLEAQSQTADATRVWARNLAGITGQIAGNDDNVRTILETGPGSFQEATRLLEQVKPTLPVLLANLTTLGQVGITYRPALQQLLVLLPPYVASQQAYSGAWTNPTGLPLGDFSITIGDPPVCTVGFLPPSSWRSPAATSVPDTPDNLYCKLPQDSPIGVRGARNYPCLNKPGKRAPTVQMCESDEQFKPLAIREHSLGPYPFDPNLISQGIPPDQRTNLSENIYAPVEGTPLPPGQPPVNVPPPPPPNETSPPVENPSTAATPPPSVEDAPVPHESSGKAPGPQPAVAQSAWQAHSPHGPSIAVAQYNPFTGEYVGADGHLGRQTDLARNAAPTGWKDLFPI